MLALIVLALLTIAFSPSDAAPTEGTQEHPSPNSHGSLGVPANRESHSPILDLNRLPEEQPNAILPQQRQGAEGTHNDVGQPSSASQHLASPSSHLSGKYNRNGMARSPLFDPKRKIASLLEIKDAQRAISVHSSSSSAPGTIDRAGVTSNPLFDAKKELLQHRQQHHRDVEVPTPQISEGFLTPNAAIAHTQGVEPRKPVTSYDWHKNGRKSDASQAWKGANPLDNVQRPQTRKMSRDEIARGEYLYWKDIREKTLKAASESQKRNSETPAGDEVSPSIGETSASVQKTQPEKAGPSSSVVATDQKKRYYQDPRPPYVPPAWMSDEVKQYYKHWYAHADEVQKFNRGERPDRPSIDGSVPFVLQHALELKERKTKEDAIRKKNKIQRTPAQEHRDFEEWRMIHDGQNLRMRIMQLHRHAVAKELGIPVDKVTHDIGLKHGVPYGPFNQTKKRKGDETDVASSSRSKRRRSGASSDAGPTRHTSKKEEGKGKKVMKKA